MHPIIKTRPFAKAYARILRAECHIEGNPMSHAQALERVARLSGYSDWNTLCAKLPLKPSRPFYTGARVDGFYLKQPFSGQIKRLETVPETDDLAIVLDFDTPVDVIRFRSLSNLRKRVAAQVSPTGISVTKTSDGAPHMIVAMQSDV